MVKAQKARPFLFLFYTFDYRLLCANHSFADDSPLTRLRRTEPVFLLERKMDNKLITTIAAVVVVIVNRLVAEFGGAELLDAEVVQNLAVVITGYIVGQGIADHGK
jgi:hypothetical protein